MKICPFCAEEIQESAIVCRYCKRDLPPTKEPEPITALEPEDEEFEELEQERIRFNSNMITLAVVAAIILGISFLVLNGIRDSREKRSAERTTSSQSSKSNSVFGNETGAFVWCQDYVRARLKSPGTAKFPFGDFTYRNLGGGSWRIMSYVDSQNSFGAVVRTNWNCEIKYLGDTNWQLIDLVLSER